MVTKDSKQKPPSGEGPEPTPEVDIDFGFGGLFKGLGNFVDLLSNLAENQQTEVNRTGEFKVKGLGDKGRGVYGFSIRSVAGGAPKVEHFGNIRSTQEGPVVADVREPLVDNFDEAAEIVIVVELPGVSESEIKIAVEEDILSLETTGERKYAKEILLAQAVDATTLQSSYKNGILEIRIKKA